MDSNSIAPVPLKTKADILQIMVGLAFDAERINEDALSSFLLMGVECADLPKGMKRRLVNIGYDIVRTFKRAA